MNLGQSHFLVFDSVITNVGGAYHSTTGIFTAPVDGIYAFNMALHINAGSLIDVCFVKDGNEVMCNNGEARNSQDSKSTSRTVILELSKGNEVRTRTNSWSGYGIQQLHGNNYSAFSGWRIA